MEISLAAEPVFNIGAFTVTNSLLTTWVVMALLLITGLLSRRFKLIPVGLQNIVEIFVLWLYDMTRTIVNNDKVARRVFPLLVIFFVFILISNWAGLIPGVGSVGFHEIHDGHEVFVPLLRAPTADLNTALALALISVTVTTVVGVAAIGPFKYVKKYIRFTSVIDFFIGLFEIISELSRILSFSFRLFGNIFAGEVLISVITFLVPYILPAPLYGFELFVGLIQAFVFTILTTVFIGLAIQDHEEHQEKEVKTLTQHGN